MLWKVVEVFHIDFRELFAYLDHGTEPTSRNPRADTIRATRLDNIRMLEAKDIGPFEYLTLQARTCRL